MRFYATTGGGVARAVTGAGTSAVGVQRGRGDRGAACGRRSKRGRGAAIGGPGSGGRLGRGQRQCEVRGWAAPAIEARRQSPWTPLFCRCPQNPLCRRGGPRHPTFHLVTTWLEQKARSAKTATFSSTVRH
jgi:hypothetical protein